MRFTKMHGIGNDYIYVNGFVEKVVNAADGGAQGGTDRHYGIGGDGLDFDFAPAAGGCADADVQRGWQRGGDVREWGSLRGEICV